MVSVTIIVVVVVIARAVAVVAVVSTRGGGGRGCIRCCCSRRYCLRVHGGSLVSCCLCLLWAVGVVEESYGVVWLIPKIVAVRCNNVIRTVPYSYYEYEV